jgi:nucleoside-diphosphate-sugar epimerase
METLRGRRILVTGATGQVAEPVARHLAADNDVVAAARFTDRAARDRLEGAGITCVAVNLAGDDFGAVPDDVDLVLNFAVVKSGRWDLDLRANAEAAGLLMDRCRGASAFLHCSSTGVYEPAGAHRLVETDPLGDNHRAIMPTYSIAKIATEVVVRTEARRLDLPTTIARLNVPYGDNGGWPAWHLALLLDDAPIAVHPDRPNLFNPIHENDVVAMIPALVGAATVPATIVNWAGDEQVALEEWCTHLGELVGRAPRFDVTEATIGGVTTDNTRRLALTGPASVTWRDGFRRMVAALHPDLDLAG